MALFTDGPVSSIDDLSAQDSQLLTVASVEGIDVTQKLGLAHDELGMELHTMLTRFGYVDQLFWLAPRLRLDSVVVTPPLKLWHAARTLEMVYSDAYNSQLNDRYAGKRNQFHQLAKWAYEKLIQTGLGIASQPVAQAATPVLVASGGGLPDGTYFVSMAWVNNSGEEGAASTASAITTASSTFSVQPGSAPHSVAGWNVYVGPAPDGMTRQNASPIAAVQPWLQPGNPLATGQPPGNGQRPTYIQPMPRIIQRG
jgi:hypothetical protein